MGQRVGYLRVSTTDQLPDRQLAGVVCDRTFTDFASGASADRPQLEAMLLHVREGDTIHVHSIDRLARNLDDLRSIVQRLVKRGVRVRFETEGLEFTGDDSPLSTMLLSVMGALAEFERSLLRERQGEGIAVAKAAGKYKGRAPALSVERATALRIACQDPTANRRAIARAFGIGVTTLYRYLASAEASL